MFKLIVLSTLFALSQAAPSIEPSLIENLKNGNIANVILTLSHQTTINSLQNIPQNLGDRSEKLWTIYETLKTTTSLSQAQLLDFLIKEKSSSAIVTPFWITNKISVRGANLELIQKLARRNDLVEIRQELIFPLQENFAKGKIVRTAPKEDKANEEWNIQLIRAPPVWATENRGQGIVVANMDTGVRATHIALSTNHRTDYGWFDPEGATESPSDEAGQGTYTMGIAVGGQKIGVAPGAQWIACKGCGMFACSESSLLSCGQWVTCPTDHLGSNPNCTLAPNVVSNGWGGGVEAWFDDVLQAWRSAGIVSTFGVGAGSEDTCGSIGSPASSSLTIAVGGTTRDGVSAVTSGTGPTGDGRIKPDLAAPAQDVRSAWGDADDSYMILSGTTAANPHVAGVAALILCEKPGLRVQEVEEALKIGAVNTEPTGRNCGDVDENTYPNNHVGFGRVDATNSVAYVVGGN